MKGLLITNKYMQNSKFSILKDGFIDAAQSIGINFSHINNFDAYKLLDESIKYDFILFYDKDIKLAKMLEDKGYILFNSSSAIEICDDKFKTYYKLYNRIIQPKTISSPFLYNGDLTNDRQFIQKCENIFSYPMIVKECYGSFGFQVYKIDNQEQLIDSMLKIGNRPFIVQEYISTSFGRDIRIQVVGNEVVCAINRINKDGDFRANITNGAKAYEYIPNDQQIEMALNATKIIGADFAGVDLLFGENDKPLLCEVNSNAHVENIGSICKVNVYKKMIEYIQKRI